MNTLYWREPLWLLLALFPLLLALWGNFRQRSQAQRYADPHLLPWVQAGANRSGWQRLLSRQTLWGLAWLLFAVSLAGPRTLQTNPDELAAPQRDLLVVLDVSRSMQATDLAPNRLQRAALELHELLNLAHGNRFGVVVYAARPHLFVPLTHDTSAVRFYLQYLETLLLPTQGSEAAAALDFARKQLTSRQQASPAAVLWLTDGDIPADQQAALQGSVQALQQAGIRLYTLGLGTEDGEAIPLPGGKWLEHGGQAVRSRLDSGLLQTLSAQTGGQYSAVKDDASDWQRLYVDGIAQAFPAQPTEEGQRWREWYVWSLLLGMVFVWLAAGEKSPLTPLLQRGEQEARHDLASPFAKGGLRGIFFLCAATMFADLAHADDSALTAGITAYRAENYAVATQHFTAAVFAASDDSERARALHNLGNSYFQQGDYAAAAQLFQDALTYRPDHVPTQQNLEFAADLQAELERRLAAANRAAADNNSSGARRERSSNALDWDQASTLTLGEGKDAPVNATMPELPAAAREKLLEKGMARLAQTGADQPQTWRKRQQSLDDARIALQQLDDNPAALWKRLFELEEGFPASLSEPNTVPGILPW